MVEQGTLVSDAPVRVADDLVMEHVGCCICGQVDGTPVGVGEDFEYHTTALSFLAVRCPRCDARVPRPPSRGERTGPHLPRQLSRLRLRRRPVRHRAQGAQPARGAPTAARRARPAGRRARARRGLRRRLPPRPAARATARPGGPARRGHRPACRRRGPPTRPRREDGPVEDSPIEPGRSTWRCASRPSSTWPTRRPAARHRPAAAPGGRLYLITDNTDSPDFRHHQGPPLGRLPLPTALEPVQQGVDAHAGRRGRSGGRRRCRRPPARSTGRTRCATCSSTGTRRAGWCEQFSLKAAPALGVFTAVDTAFTVVGRGALLRVILRRPR